MKGMTFHLNKRELETAFHVSSCEAGLLTGNLRTNGTHRSTGLRERGSYREEDHFQGDLQHKLTKAFAIQDDPCSKNRRQCHIEGI